MKPANSLAMIAFAMLLFPATIQVSQAVNATPQISVSYEFGEY